MKKFIAFQFAVLYFIFTSCTGVNISSSEELISPNWQATHKTFVGADATAKEGISFSDATEVLNKAHKQPHIGGKVNSLRGGIALLPSKDFLSFLHLDYCATDISMVTPLLYQSDIFIKNCVLRI